MSYQEAPAYIERKSKYCVVYLFSSTPSSPSLLYPNSPPYAQHTHPPTAAFYLPLLTTNRRSQRREMTCMGHGRRKRSSGWVYVGVESKMGVGRGSGDR